MNNRKLIIIVVIGVLILGTTWIFFNKREAKKEKEIREITLWHRSSGSKGLQFVVDEFNKTHSQIKLKPKYIHYSQFASKLEKAVIAGNVPDLVLADSATQARWADMGAYADLTKEIENWGQADKYYQGAWATTVYKGKNYGVPQNINTIALFYNKDLFKQARLDPKQPPQTWQEVKEYAAKINNLGDKIYGINFGAQKSEASTYQFLSFLWQAGGDYTDLTSPAAQNALGFWKELVEEGYAPKSVLNSGQFELIQNFSAGKIGMAINGPWGLGTLKKNADFDFGVAMMPVKKEVGVPASTVGGENLAIMKGTNNKQAAWEFIKFSQQPEILKKWCELDSRIPARKDIVKESAVWNSEYMKVFTKQLKYARARGPHPKWPKISRPLQEAIQKALTEGEVEKALKKAQEEINKVLEE